MGEAGGLPTPIGSPKSKQPRLSTEAKKSGTKISKSDQTAGAGSDREHETDSVQKAGADSNQKSGANSNQKSGVNGNQNSGANSNQTSGANDGQNSGANSNQTSGAGADLAQARSDRSASNNSGNMPQLPYCDCSIRNEMFMYQYQNYLLQQVIFCNVVKMIISCK